MHSTLLYHTVWGEEDKTADVFHSSFWFVQLFRILQTLQIVTDFHWKGTVSREFQCSELTLENFSFHKKFRVRAGWALSGTALSRVSSITGSEHSFSTQKTLALFFRKWLCKHFLSNDQIGKYSASFNTVLTSGNCPGQCSTLVERCPGQCSDWHNAIPDRAQFLVTYSIKSYLF